MRTVFADPQAGRSLVPVPQLNGGLAQPDEQHRPAARKRVTFNGIPPGLLLGAVPAGDGADARARRSILALRRGPVRFRRNTTVAAEGDSADCIFLVAKGIVRSCKTFVDGGRSIVAFHLPGELFGWTCGGTHLLSAEAATDAVVMFVKRSALLSAAARDTALANFLVENTANELRQTQEHSLLISRDARHRIAAFLTDLSRRTGNSTRLDVPMSCHDIADYLGLTIETVSRTITKLVRCGSIARAGSRRTFILKDPGSLAAMLN